MVKFAEDEYEIKQDAKFQTWANNLNYVRDVIIPMLREFDEDKTLLKEAADKLGMPFRNLARIARKYPKYLTLEKTGQHKSPIIYISIHKDLR